VLLENNKNNKNKSKAKTTRNKRIYCGVPPMSAKFNVFSQTVQLLTAAPQVVLKMMPLPLVVVALEWP
jgi:hypothetical protein